MRLRKEDRLNQFRAVQGQIQRISAEIAGNSDDAPTTITVYENDLSLKRLEDYQNELQRLYNEKVSKINSCFLPTPLKFIGVLFFKLTISVITFEE